MFSISCIKRLEAFNYSILNWKIHTFLHHWVIKEDAKSSWASHTHTHTHAHHEQKKETGIYSIECIVLCAPHTSNAHLNAKQNEYESSSVLSFFFILCFSYISMWYRYTCHITLHKGCRKPMSDLVHFNPNDMCMGHAQVKEKTNNISKQR